MSSSPATPHFSIYIPIDSNKLQFPHAINTNADLVAFMHKCVYPSFSPAVKGFLMGSTIECLLTLLIGAYLLFIKRQMGKLWLYTRRTTMYGTFILPNSLFVLVVGIVIYLMGWMFFAPSMLYSFYKKRSVYLAYWIVPYPWMALVAAAGHSVYGFMLSCSPRSPLSIVGISPTSTISRFMPPVPRYPIIMNSIIVAIPILLFTVSTVLSAQTGRHFYLAERIGADLFQEFASLDTSLLEQTTNADLIERSKVVWAAYSEVYRFTCMSLVLYAVLAYIISAFMLVYGVPNQVNLIHHACDMFPQRLPEYATKGTIQKLKFLLTDGRPSKIEGDQTTQYQNTWKMTLFCIAHAGVLMVAVPLFGTCPAFLVHPGFQDAVVKGNIGPVISVALVYISGITVLCCTHFILLSLVITFEPLFRMLQGRSFRMNTQKALQSSSSTNKAANPGTLDVELATPSSPYDKDFSTRASSQTYVDHFENINGDRVEIVTKTIVKVDSVM